jgi:tRNA modification GTPase
LVSHRPGTTRDYLTAEVVWSGLRVELVDTAGLTDLPADELDDLGQTRSREQLAGSDLVLWVRDCASPAEPAGPATAPPGAPPGRSLVVWNKADLALPPPASESELVVSARTGLNLSLLKAEVVRLATGHENPEPPEVAPSFRHQAALRRSEEFFRNSLDALDEGRPLDICAFELRLALEALDLIRGRTTAEDVLKEIFSRFCLGK